MRVADLNWMQLESYLEGDDRIEEVPDLLEHQGGATGRRDRHGGRGSPTLTETTHTRRRPAGKSSWLRRQPEPDFPAKSGRRESNPRD